MNRLNTAIRLLGMTAVTAACLSVLMAAGRPTGAAGTPLTAELLGENEIPPAATEGFGTADLRLNSGQGTIGLDLIVDGTAPITRLHIHIGDATTNGPILVFFFDTVVDPGLDPIPVGSDGVALSFVAEDVERDLVKAIRKNPESYYVNLHSEAFPGGELRGQLTRP